MVRSGVASHKRGQALHRAEVHDLPDMVCVVKCEVQKPFGVIGDGDGVAHLLLRCVEAALHVVPCFLGDLGGRFVVPLFAFFSAHGLVVSAAHHEVAPEDQVERDLPD